MGNRNRTLAILATLVLLLALAGCKGQGSEDESGEEEKTESAEAEGAGEEGAGEEGAGEEGAGEEGAGEEGAGEEGAGEEGAEADDSASGAAKNPTAPTPGGAQAEASPGGIKAVEGTETPEKTGGAAGADGAAAADRKVTPEEEEIVKLLEELGGIAQKNSKDCDAMAKSFTAWNTKNAKRMKQLSAKLGNNRPPPQALQARLKASAEKLMTGMMACQDSAEVQKAFQAIGQSMQP